MARRVKIHREGYKIILVAGLLILAVNVLTSVYIRSSVVNVTLGIVTSLLFIFIVYFFRDTARITPDSETDILSPADGRVVVIEEVHEKEYFNEKKIQLSIFMSPANVHVNRNPISGKVKHVKYYKGKYLVAWHPKSSELNEHNNVVIEHKNKSSIMVKQIAGKLARRIVNYVEEGDEIERGHDFGFIKFGSRLDVFLPIGTPIKVDIGDHVRGGETILASFDEDQSV